MCSETILHHQKPKTTLISIRYLKDKHIVVYPCTRMIFSNKKEQITDTCNMTESQNSKPSEKRQTQKGYMPYDSMYITFRKRLNVRDRKHVSGSQGLRAEGGV